MMNDDEKLVARFFEQQTMEIDDGGFSRKVMRRLPERRRGVGVWWTVACVAAGIAMFFLLDMGDSLVATFGNVCGDVLGLLSQANVQDASPLTVYIGLLTIGAVLVYNAAMTIDTKKGFIR